MKTPSVSPVARDERSIKDSTRIGHPQTSPSRGDVLMEMERKERKQTGTNATLCKYQIQYCKEDNVFEAEFRVELAV